MKIIYSALLIVVFLLFCTNKTISRSANAKESVKENKEIIYSGFFYRELHEKTTSAFLNLIFTENGLYFEFDFFDEDGKRFQKRVKYLKGKGQSSPYKVLNTYKNDSYWAVGGRYDQFEYFLGQYVEFEFKNNELEIHGGFKKEYANDYFYCVRTDQRAKLSKGDVLFTGKIINNEPSGKGFFLKKGKDGKVSDCLYSDFTNSKDYNGLTVYMNKYYVCKGFCNQGSFENNYSINQWAPCYFEDYDHVVARWEVVLSDQNNVKKGAYGFNCGGKIAKQCNVDFNNCKQLIHEKTDNSLLLALGGMAAIIAGGMVAISSISSGGYSGSTNSGYSNRTSEASQKNNVDVNIGLKNTNCNYTEIKYDSTYLRCSAKVKDPYFQVKCSNGKTKYYWFCPVKSRDLICDLTVAYYEAGLAIGEQHIFLSTNKDEAMKILCECNK